MRDLKMWPVETKRAPARGAAGGPTCAFVVAIRCVTRARFLATLTRASLWTRWAVAGMTDSGRRRVLAASQSCGAIRGR